MAFQELSDASLKTEPQDDCCPVSIRCRSPSEQSLSPSSSASPALSLSSSESEDLITPRCASTFPDTRATSPEAEKSSLRSPRDSSRYCASPSMSDASETMSRLLAVEPSSLSRGYASLSRRASYGRLGSYSPSTERLVPPHVVCPVIKEMPRSMSHSHLLPLPHHFRNHDDGFSRSPLPSPPDRMESRGVPCEQRRWSPDVGGTTMFDHQLAYMQRMSPRWGANGRYDPPPCPEGCKWPGSISRLDETLPSYGLRSPNSLNGTLRDAELAFLSMYKLGYPYGQPQPCRLPCCVPEGPYYEVGEKRRQNEDRLSPSSLVRVPAKRPSPYTKFQENTSRTNEESLLNYGSNLVDNAKSRSGAFSVIQPPHHHYLERVPTPSVGAVSPKPPSYDPSSSRARCASRFSRDERFSCDSAARQIGESAFEPRNDEHEKYDHAHVQGVQENGLPPLLRHKSSHSIQVSTVDSSTSARSPSQSCSGLMGLTKVANEHLGQEIAKERKRTKAKGVNNNCLHLWEFLRNMLNSDVDPRNRCIEWTSRERGEFRLIKTALIADLWGQSKNRSHMTYEKMARAMRYYYKMHILEKVPNKRLHFRFGEKMLAKVLGGGCAGYRNSFARDEVPGCIRLPPAAVGLEVNAERTGGLVAYRNVPAEGRLAQHPPPLSPVTPTPGSSSLGGSSDSDSESGCSEDRDDYSVRIGSRADANLGIATDVRSRMHHAKKLSLVRDAYSSAPARIACRPDAQVLKDRLQPPVTSENALAVKS